MKCRTWAGGGSGMMTVSSTASALGRRPTVAGAGAGIHPSETRSECTSSTGRLSQERWLQLTTSDDPYWRAIGRDALRLDRP